MTPDGKTLNLERLSLDGVVPAERTHGERVCAIEESKFQRRSQHLGNPVVNSIRRDSAEGL